MSDAIRNLKTLDAFFRAEKSGKREKPWRRRQLTRPAAVTISPQSRWAGKAVRLP
jgi:hypothetical protein